MREYSYKVATRASCECRDNNPTHKDAFNLPISDLKKKNPHGQGSTVRILFTEENSNGENVSFYNATVMTKLISSFQNPRIAMVKKWVNEERRGGSCSSILFAHYISTLGIVHKIPD